MSNISTDISNDTVGNVQINIKNFARYDHMLKIISPKISKFNLNIQSTKSNAFFEKTNKQKDIIILIIITIVLITKVTMYGKFISY